ncbi:MAG TPA: hypothetical protein VGR76_21710, partial [Candidatus Angelobacter sp.]|nr:hypothetical protein [Candidatus Angelobacter sp.]
MNEPPTKPSRFGASLYRNWISLIGLVIVTASLFAFLLLFLLDSFAHFANPYVGILTYLVAPVFMFFGLALGALGLLLRRRQIVKANGGAVPAMQIDLSRPRDRRIMAVFLTASIGFL